jgi:thiamine biosynthesis protein ThiI
LTSVIAHYSEIALKGKNRPWFLQRLTRNLRTALAGLHVSQVRVPMGRLEIVLGDDNAWPEVQARLERVFGIANFSIARRAPVDLDLLGDAIVANLPSENPESFRIALRRADKRFPIPSPTAERVLGKRVQDARGWRVDLSKPAFVIGVEILADDAFYYFGKIRGAGGLPTGSAGRVAVLLSGGIDSPVAAWQMMRRGCVATLVHFHSYPFLSQTSQQKARALARILTQYQYQTRLYLVPFGELQRQITLSVPGPLRVVVYRRLMFRIAERIAHRVRAHALVTGEVVGQVASQTLENLRVIDRAANMPVFRPLIGTDKEEITTAAKRLGTFPVSIVPDEDCCTLFTPRHPVIRARFSTIEEAESNLPIDTMVQQAIDAAVIERFSYPHVAAANQTTAFADPDDRIGVSGGASWRQ